jgi:hypothetical protein
MGKFTDLARQRFGKWNVLERGPNKKRYSAFFCKCDCGNKCLVSSTSLVQGESTQCSSCSGRIKSKLGIEKSRHLRFNPETPIKDIYYKIKYRAVKSRKLEFTITFEEFKGIVFGNCVYTGLAPVGSRTYRNGRNSKHNGKVTSVNSIDRIDPRYGYHIWNVQPCNTYINFAKNDLLPEEWDNLIERMSETFYTKNPGKLLILAQTLGLAQVA